MFSHTFGCTITVVISIACLAVFRPSRQTPERFGTFVSNITSIRQQIQGTWKLVSYELQIHGPWTMNRYPLGKDATGLILYTSDGYMSAQLMMPGSPLFTSRSYHDGSPEELASAAKHYLAYSGSYSVEMDRDMKPLIRHYVEVSLYPNWLNTNQTRICKLGERDLTLSPDKLFNWNVRYILRN
jgi:hypothetical protein